VGIYVKNGLDLNINPRSIFMDNVLETILIDVKVNHRILTKGLRNYKSCQLRSSQAKKKLAIGQWTSL
jgi:hypothetical protein